MLSKSIPSIYNIVPKIERDSWLHRWESRVKLISCIVMTFALVFLNTPILLVGSLGFLSVIVLSMGVSLKQYTIRIGCFLPFIIFISMPILLGGGLPPTEERITLALLLNLKGLNSLSIMFILFFSQPIPKLLNGLANLKLPGFFISIIFLSWRYVFILIERLSKFYRTLKSRLFQPGFHQGSFKVYGEVMGGMLLRSIDTSDKVYRAMASRGFNGIMPTSQSDKIVALDIFKSTVMISCVLFLHIVEKWCL